MDLRTWVGNHPYGKRGKAIGSVARACGVSSSFVRHWIAGIRIPRAEMCVTVESATGGQVTRVELRPDLFVPVPARAADAAGGPRRAAASG